MDGAKNDYIFFSKAKGPQDFLDAVRIETNQRLPRVGDAFLSKEALPHPDSKSRRHATLDLGKFWSDPVAMWRWIGALSEGEEARKTTECRGSVLGTLDLRKSAAFYAEKVMQQYQTRKQACQSTLSIHEVSRSFTLDRHNWMTDAPPRITAQINLNLDSSLGRGSCAGLAAILDDGCRIH